MISKEVLKGLLDHKKISLLKVLYEAKEELYLREIAKKSGVPVASVFRILQDLIKIGLVRVREVKMMKFYSLVRDGRERFLEDWFKEESWLEVFVRAMQNKEGLKRILLQGKAEPHQANIILIGEKLDDLGIKEVVNKIKEKGFDISYLILTEEQFNKLDAMGLYGGEKKVLFCRENGKLDG